MPVGGTTSTSSVTGALIINSLGQLSINSTGQSEEFDGTTCTYCGIYVPVMKCGVTDPIGYALFTPECTTQIYKTNTGDDCIWTDCSKPTCTPSLVIRFDPLQPKIPDCSHCDCPTVYKVRNSCTGQYMLNAGVLADAPCPSDSSHTCYAGINSPKRGSGQSCWYMAEAYGPCEFTGTPSKDMSFLPCTGRCDCCDPLLIVTGMTCKGQCDDANRYGHFSFGCGSIPDYPCDSYRNYDLDCSTGDHIGNDKWTVHPHLMLNGTYCSTGCDLVTYADSSDVSFSSAFTFGNACNNQLNGKGSCGKYNFYQCTQNCYPDPPGCDPDTDPDCGETCDPEVCGATTCGAWSIIPGHSETGFDEFSYNISTVGGVDFIELTLSLGCSSGVGGQCGQPASPICDTKANCFYGITRYLGCGIQHSISNTQDCVDGFCNPGGSAFLTLCCGGF